MRDRLADERELETTMTMKHGDHAVVGRRLGYEPRLVIGIGASAGGLEACRRLLDALPSDTGMAFVMVMHLDPTHESRMAEILGLATTMPVVQVVRPVPLERDCVYVIAPSSWLELRDGVLQPSRPDDPRGSRRPIDAFFSSLAADVGARAVAIVLSGADSDGSLGIREVKAAGGLCIAQEPTTAEYQDMPRAAIATSLVDHVAPVEAMPLVLLDYAGQFGSVTSPQPPEPSAPEEPESNGAFERILEQLGRTYGVNFRSAYKRGTLERRTERRMALRQVPTWDAYLQVLQKDPAEVATLYRDLLIDVTQFFRDREVWEHLERELVPKLVAEHEDDTPIKIWVAGCARGEEAYSFAIVFREQIERTGRTIKVQVFATDVAEDALTTARRGRYPRSIEENVSRERLERFFRREGDHYEVTPEVRQSVTFATHNLLADPPFSGLTLVSCRNVLIYLESHAQHRVLQMFHFSLRPDGLLLLGASETVGRYGDLFEAVSTSARAYRPTPITKAIRTSDPRWTAVLGRSFVGPPARMTPPAPRGPKVSRVIEQIVLGRFTWACVAVTEAFEIRSFFGPTHEYLVQPIGEARMDLLAWAKPGLYPRLRAGLDRAALGKERVVLDDLWVDRDGVTTRVECTIEPITPLPGEARLFLVAFRDLRTASLREIVGASSDEPLVRQLESELRAAREELQTTVEQLQTSNEEYRASHEELLSLNEELQSNNEELQASKEELQSLNEEMITINRQLEERNGQLRMANTDITNLLVSAHVPIIFLDRELRIRRFTPAATELMHLIPADVGRSAEDIKERFRDGMLLQDAKRVLDKLIPITTEVQTEDGRWYTRRVVPYRTEDDRIDGVCIAFHDVTEAKTAAEALDEARIFAETIVDTTRVGLVVLDPRLRVVSANSCFYETFRLSKATAAGTSLFELVRGQWDSARLRKRLEQVLDEGKELRHLELEHELDPHVRRVLRIDVRAMRRRGQSPHLLLAIEDVTEHKQAQQVIEARAEELAREHQRKDEFLAMLGHELRNPLSALLHGLDLLGLSSDPPRVEQVRSMMTRQAKRIGAMLDELLDIARLNAGKIEMARELVDASHAVQTAIEAVTPLLELRKSRLRVSLPEEPGEALVRGDLGRLTQVVENLLNNAAKYSEEGAEITVLVEADEDCVQIRVRDAGIGMDAELLPHIFELFVQDARALDRSAGGLGLGLSLVKRVVELHGGRVEASSPGRGQGSEFVVTLPRASDERAKGGRPPSEAGEGSGPRRRVLVVDDEADTAGLLTELLALHGHDARAVGDGPAALVVARSYRPDVVLLDLGLPRMDGYEVARLLREEHGPKVQLVAITGYQRDAQRLDRSGFDHHVIKPPDMSSLLEWLRQSGVGRSG